MRRMTLWICLLSLVAAAGFTAMAKSGRGTLRGTTVLTPAGDGQATFAVDLTGNIQHLGRSRVVFSGTADVSPEGEFSPAGLTTGTVTAANGDTLTFILRWRSAQIEPGVHRVAGPFEVTGGTGRFAGAGGGGQYETVIDFEAADTEARLEGMLLL